MNAKQTALPPGLPAPAPSPDGLDAPYWAAARRGELLCQRCRACGAFQWGPEWICHRCLSFDVGWERVESKGTIFSFERVWHPVHPALHEACPYVVVLVELAHAGGVRMLGNLVGDARAEISIGERVTAVFEDHDDGDPPYSLVQWRRSD